MSAAGSELPLGVPAGAEGALARKRSTGEYWAGVNPELAVEALRLWEETHNISVIAKAVGASRNTVHAFLGGRGVLKVEQTALKDLSLSVVQLMAEQIVQEPERVPWASKAITAKLFADTAMVISGQPTQIVRHEIVTLAPEVTAADLERYRRAGMGLLGGVGNALRPVAESEVLEAVVVEGEPPI